MRTLFIFLLVVGTVSALGCTGPAPRCTPGATEICTCSNGTTGRQVCATDGTLGPCGDCGTTGCTSGASQACTCGSGASGTQTCSGGAWGTCLGCPTGCAVAGCNAGYQCAASGTCVLNPSGLWTVTIADGMVPVANCGGTFWDYGGNPDPFVTFSPNGVPMTTSVQFDTLTPVWNRTFTATAATLLSGFPMTLWDYDPIGSNEVICSWTAAQLAAGEPDLVRGQMFGLCSCAGGPVVASVRFSYTPQ